MATVRNATGAILDTVTNVATTASDALNTITGSIGMANRFIENAAIDQKERHVVHRTMYRSQLIREASMEIARGNKEALEFVRESNDNKALFEAAQTELLQAFEAFDS